MKFRDERNFTFEEKEIRPAETSKRSRCDDRRDRSIHLMYSVRTA